MLRFVRGSTWVRFRGAVGGFCERKWEAVPPWWRTNSGAPRFFVCVPRDTVPAVQQQPRVDRLIWLDGEFVPWERATVHILSHSLQRGSLVFDYMSVHQTPRGAAVFRLDLHVQRMLRSCELMGLPLRQGAALISEAIIETARANPGAKAVKASAYFPSVEVDVVPLDTRVSLAIAAYDPQADIIDPLSQSGERQKRAKQVRLWLEKQTHQRREDIVSPQAKVAANYAASMTAKARALEHGFDEILLVDEENQLAEGPTTNVFVVDGGGVLCTPPERRVLRGVTRQSIIELAKADGIELREVPLSPEALTTAREVFLTGTSAGVLPVVSVDGRPVGTSCPGPVAESLSQHFERVTAGRDPDFDHWLCYVDEA